MAAGIDVDKLADELAAGLSEYSEEVTQKIKKTVDTVAKDTVKELKNTSPRRTGDYAKDWTTKTGYEDRRTKRKTVYNKSHYQLTHLLEFGHAKRNGGRVDAQSHIKAAEQKAAQQFEEALKGEI